MTASDDPIRPAAPRPEGGPQAAPTTPARPAPERPAPAAQTERPATQPPVEPTGKPAEKPAARPTAPAPEEPATGGGGRTAGMWIGLILGAIILVLLLIFVLQNNVTAGFQYFGAGFDLPLGVAMLLAAIAGALVMALVGSVRMAQMSWTIRKLRKQQEKVQRASR